MDKRTELRNTIQELHDNNAENSDIMDITGFLLKLMNVLKKNESNGGKQK